MNLITALKPYPLLILLLLIQSCVEPVEFETDTFESALVVEATITDELKQQEIMLSRTYRFEENEPGGETGARVRVIAGDANTYEFEEIHPGVYQSLDAFRAAPNVNYELDILTRDGKTFISEPVRLQSSTGIDSLYARRTGKNGKEGIAIQLDNYNPRDASEFFRYEYVETYKIVSRYSSPYDLVYIDGDFVEVEKTREETICYNTVNSANIIVANTTSLSSNDLEGLLVRFIQSTDPVLSRRYSILVKQYAVSREAYTYYETLKNLSGSDNLFSQNQPGFIYGNIFSPDDPEEKVIGFFNVSSVSSKRLFFNYIDFFDPELRPYFTEDCNPDNPSITPFARRENLVSLLEYGFVKYLGSAPDEGEDGGPYLVVEAECVDCTIFGTNEIPDFWEE